MVVVNLSIPKNLVYNPGNIIVGDIGIGMELKQKLDQTRAPTAGCTEKWGGTCLVMLHIDTG